MTALCDHFQSFEAAVWARCPQPFTRGVSIIHIFWPSCDLHSIFVTLTVELVRWPYIRDTFFLGDSLLRWSFIHGLHILCGLRDLQIRIFKFLMPTYRGIRIIYGQLSVIVAVRLAVRIPISLRKFAGGNHVQYSN